MAQYVLAAEEAELLDAFYKKKALTLEEHQRAVVLDKLISDGRVIRPEVAQRYKSAFEDEPKQHRFKFKLLDDFLKEAKKIDRPKYYDLAIRMYMGHTNNRYNVVVVPVLSLTPKGDRRRHEKDLEKTVFDFLNVPFFALNTAHPTALDRDIERCKTAINGKDPSGVRLIFYSVKNAKEFLKNAQPDDNVVINFGRDGQKLTTLISIERNRKLVTVEMEIELESKGKQVLVKVQEVYFDDGNRIPPPPAPGSGDEIDDSHF